MSRAVYSGSANAVGEMLVRWNPAEVRAEPAALEEPKAGAVNERHGDDHGVDLGKLRALAKWLRTQQELVRELWARRRHRDELDTMLREARASKVHDVIDAELRDASDRLQWAMNTCLAHVGIEHVEYRARALDIG